MKISRRLFGRRALVGLPATILASRAVASAEPAPEPVAAPTVSLADIQTLAISLKIKEAVRSWARTCDELGIARHVDGGDTSNRSCRPFASFIDVTVSEHYSFLDNTVAARLVAREPIIQATSVCSSSGEPAVVGPFRLSRILLFPRTMFALPDQVFRKKVHDFLDEPFSLLLVGEGDTIPEYRFNVEV